MCLCVCVSSRIFLSISMCASVHGCISEKEIMLVCVSELCVCIPKCVCAR